ncbi:MAG: dTMP kinase [Proteobacteria bacterium]|nr:dTMP kinase [Pseudomonadota bacterium]
MIITFEGIEGCGKSTQIEKFKESLKKLKLDYVTFREPGGTELSEEIREILLNKDLDISPLSELLLFESARAELITKKILPEIGKKIIIIDRFIDSTTAYQGYGRGIPIEIISKLNEIVVGDIKIDRTYLLDAPIEILEKRNSHKKKDRIERESFDFHNRIRMGFLKIAQKNIDRVLIIDATKSVEEIQKIILEDFLKIYGYSTTG